MHQRYRSLLSSERIRESAAGQRSVGLFSAYSMSLFVSFRRPRCLQVVIYPSSTIDSKSFVERLDPEMTIPQSTLELESLMTFPRTLSE